MARECPLDRIYELIQTQFNYEIYLKQRELHAIDQEMDRAESCLQTLESLLIKNTHGSGIYDERHANNLVSDRMTKRASVSGRASPSVSSTSHTGPTLTDLLAKLPDGSIVL
jgi:hypothetical protein